MELNRKKKWNESHGIASSIGQAGYTLTAINADKTHFWKYSNPSSYKKNILFYSIYTVLFVVLFVIV